MTSQAARSATRSSLAGAPRGLWDRFGPWCVVGLAVAYGLYELRAAAAPVAYLNDSAMHQQMVSYAVHQLRGGHFPIDGWYPYLGLGSPHLQNYQGLPATLTALLGLVIGPAHAFGWSLYLLLAFWPLSVYFSARLFELDRWTAAGAAALAPLIMSAPGVGYEYGSYLWLGWGVWTQLWGMWVLPLAWGFTFQAVNRKRYFLPAAALVALTVALHFMTGYLAALAVIVLPLLGRSDFLRRVGRATVVAAGSFAMAAWVVVPVFTRRGYTALNEFLQHSTDANSFGARKVLEWLVTGQLYDAGRFPVITIFVGLGLVTCVIRFRRDPTARALVVLWAICLVLFFGRPTLGPLFDVVPGARNIFLRRLVAGVHLSGLLIAGAGAAATARLVIKTAARVRPELAPARWLRVVAVAAFVVVLAPAWSQVGSYATRNGNDVHYQQEMDATAGAQVDALVERVKALGDGRVYAGLPTNWGARFYVGDVQVYIYLATQDVDEVGFTLRTESLMSDPEAYFDETDPGDYAMFGIRYLILPVGHPPPVPAKLLMTAGPYDLWTIPAVSYFQVVDTINSLPENENDVGSQTASLLSSGLQTRGDYLTVAFDGHRAAAPTRPFGTTVTGSPGVVLAQRDDLLEGRASVTVVARRRAVVLLSSSYDPGWTVTVDGKAAKTEMIAPALVGVTVGPGVHRVVFVWQAFSYYPELFALGGVTVAGFLIVPVLWRRRRRDGSGATGGEM